MNNATRNILLILTLTSSTLATRSVAAQQNASAASPDDAKKPPPVASSQQQSAANNLLAEGTQSQPMSLADMARLARAKKKDEPKAVKVIDDENMPRGGIYIGGSAPDSSSPSAKTGEKLVLLDFWASWCGPCRESLPDLKRFQAAFSSDQVEVISIDEDRDERTWNAFVSQNQMNWEQRFDAGGESARRYGVTGFPTYILMDSKGKVLQRYQGEDPEQSLVDRIGPDVKRAQEAQAVL
jgi:thiol-disulfide isomerase/thioredoxin